MHADFLGTLRRLALPLLVGCVLAVGCDDDGPTDDDGAAGSGNGSGTSAGEGGGATGGGSGSNAGGSGATGGAGSSCPDTQPRGRESCSEEGQVCEFGEECCCGQCYPSYGCVCSAGMWSCSYTDACFAPSCGGAGDGGNGIGGGI